MAIQWIGESVVVSHAVIDAVQSDAFMVLCFSMLSSYGMQSHHMSIIKGKYTHTRTLVYTGHVGKKQASRKSVSHTYRQTDR